MSTLSEKLLECKNKKGYRSVAALAKDVGIPVTTIYDVIRERTNHLSVENSQKLADFMGISVDELYGKEKSPDVVETKSGEDDEILNLLHTLPEEKRSEVLRYMKYLANN